VHAGQGGHEARRGGAARGTRGRRSGRRAARGAMGAGGTAAMLHGRASHAEDRAARRRSQRRGQQGCVRVGRDVARRGRLGAACGGTAATRGVACVRGAGPDPGVHLDDCARASNRATIGDPDAMERDEGERGLEEKEH
jgi:hypothetical protein